MRNIRRPKLRNLDKRRFFTLLVICAVVVFGGYKTTFLKAAPTPLTWAPPTLTNPVTVNIGQGNTQNTLDPAKDYTVILPTSHKIGSTTLSGGHNIVIKGGWLTIDPASIKDDANGRAIYIKGATGTVHVEGVYIDNTDGGQGDAFAINAPQAIVQLENIRAINLKGTYNSAHADCVQPWGGVKELRIDHFTCTDMYQGLQIDQDLGDIDRTIIKNTNLVNLPNTLTSDPSLAGGYSLWLGGAACNNIYPVEFTEFYIQPKPGRALSNSVWPPASNTVCPAVASGGEVSWPALAGTISGSVKQGPPPGGDFVPDGSVGLGYTSPGYDSPSLRGDVAGPQGIPDGRLDLYDLSYLIRHYDTTDTAADITGPNGIPDGKADIYDISYVIRNYQQ
jgi:hypothetical protein